MVGVDSVLVPLLQSLREEDEPYQYVRPPVVHIFFLLCSDRKLLKLIKLGEKKEETVGVRLAKLRCEARHLETIWRFIFPEMYKEVDEKMIQTHVAIKEKAQSLAAIEARSLVATPLPHLTPSGIEDYARGAIEHLLSCSARSVHPCSFLVSNIQVVYF